MCVMAIDPFGMFMQFRVQALACVSVETKTSSLKAEL